MTESDTVDRNRPKRETLTERSQRVIGKALETAELDNGKLDRSVVCELIGTDKIDTTPPGQQSTRRGQVLQAQRCECPQVMSKNTH